MVVLAHECQAAYDADAILQALEQLVADVDAETVDRPRLDLVLISLETCLSLSGFYDSDECIRYHLRVCITSHAYLQLVGEPG
jgi:hypothetical protein